MHSIRFMVGRKMGKLDALEGNKKRDFSSGKVTQEFMSGYDAGYDIGTKEEQNKKKKVTVLTFEKPAYPARCLVCGGPEGDCKCVAE